jgi:hypothetical protein
MCVVQRGSARLKCGELALEETHALLGGAEFRIDAALKLASTGRSGRRAGRLTVIGSDSPGRDQRRGGAARCGHWRVRSVG